MERSKNRTGKPSQAEKTRSRQRRHRAGKRQLCEKLDGTLTSGPGSRILVAIFAMRRGSATDGTVEGFRVV